MKWLPVRRICVLLLFSSLHVAAMTIGEDQFKSAMLYNILQFVKWPAGSMRNNGALTICHPESSSTAAMLGSLSGRTVQQRTLRLHAIASPDDAAGSCDVLWVNAEQSEFLERAGLRARERPILIVGEGRNSVASGAAIGIYIANGKARLVVGERSARHPGVEISARLQQIAQRRDDD